MRLALIADAFPPARSSGAVQLRDLSAELVRQGHDVTVMVASPDLDRGWLVEHAGDVRILRLRSPHTKDVGYVRRTLAELAMPFAMLRRLRASPLGNERWDGIVWYSPTIFLGPIVAALKRVSRCRAYLIIRDIFPEWAADMGLMGKGLPYWFLKGVAAQQYATADVIGVQTPGNLAYFDRQRRDGLRRVEVLHNWLAEAPNIGCSIAVDRTPLRGRRIFVYAGNMGIAQGMEVLIGLAAELRARQDIGFLFVGRGSEAQRLRTEAAANGLDNVVFEDEINPDEIPGLYAQCAVGLVALDPRHRTHNIPGKFLSYMAAGLPVLASINPGNDLVDLIAGHRVGRTCTTPSAGALAAEALGLLDARERDLAMAGRCRALSATMFSSSAAAEQVASGLES